MMFDYNVSDHWSEGTPIWLKSLVSSLDIGHGRSYVLPLVVVVEEIAEWVELASGAEAWKKRDNRNSLQRDLDQSIAALGPILSGVIAGPEARFRAAFLVLRDSPGTVLQQPPGTRIGAIWTDVLSAARDLLVLLESDEAVRASWDDLVATARDRSMNGWVYRPIAELLFEQLQRRGLSADGVFRELVSILAFGRDPSEIPSGERDRTVEDRLVVARDFVGMVAEVGSVVVWLGYKGRIHEHFSAGPVSFYDAMWVVRNAKPGRQEFEHKAELSKIVQYGHTFRVAERVDEESDVDTIVRVDLGATTRAGAVERAAAIVDIILDVSIHLEGGIRPQLAEYAVLFSGENAGGGRKAVGATGFPDDTYGANITTEAIGRHGARIAEALARQELPRFLSAAIEAQVALDRPFSRDMALRRPSEADISSVIPLADRVVQHVAAYAAMGPNELFDLLGERWAHARWLSDLQRAAGMCLLGGGGRNDLLTELTREWLSDRPTRPWILFLAERAEDFLSLCRLEHERVWIARMFASISDHADYAGLIGEYEEEGEILGGRRKRVRNALVHGNPAGYSVVESVREYAEFIGNSALYYGLEAFFDGTDPALVLAKRTDEYIALQSGQNAASFWRGQVG